MKLMTKGLLWAAIPLLIEAIFAAAVVVMDRTERTEEAGVARAKETVAHTYELMALLIDAETGIRGYIITANPRFTEPYDHAVANVPQALRRLRSLGADIAPLESKVGPILAYQTAQRDRVAAGRDEAVALVVSGMGKRMMDGFRAAAEEFLTRERSAQSRRTAAHAALRQRLRNTVVIGVVANTALAALLVIVCLRGVARRLGVVVQNTQRLERGELLRRRLRGGDEIALLDARFHAMAEALRASRRALEESNADLEAYSYSVSHDLRAPLRAVSGYARIMEEDYAGRLDGEGREVLGAIRSEAARMGQLIEDLLSFSRLGRTAVSAAPVDVAAVVRDALQDVPPANVAVEALPPAQADRALLRQVFVNLLSNAVKFSKGAGEARIEVGGARENGHSVYWVRDHGAGFDMRLAGKLFKVFQRLHSAREFPGTGVGLAIVQRVISKHGGRVWAESEEGRGACFYFTLPHPEEARR